MIEPEYTVDYFIDFFSAIPGNQWTIQKYTDNQGRHCAYGHCGIGNIPPTEQDAMKYRDLKQIFSSVGLNVTDVNDGRGEFQEVTPKGRILGVLQRIQEA